jgi:hypothetical protein
MKSRCIVTLCLAAAIAAAQGPTISIAPHVPAPEAKRVPKVGAAVLGYVVGPGPAEVHPLFGTAQRPQLGEAAAVPPGAARLYLPPRQQYVLVEQSSDAPMSVWTLHRAIAHNETPEPIVIPGVMAHPDLVAFSPRGDSAVLYSQSAGSIEVLTHLPAEPTLSRTISLATVGTPAKLAIADDGALVVADMGDRNLALSSDGGWQRTALAYTPKAWTFLPKTHDLVVSDSEQKTIVLLPNLGAGSTAVRVLSQGAPADSLAVTKTGDQLVAANLETRQIWTIDVKTATLTPQDAFAKVDTLSALRDGFTFLLSTSPSVSLLKLTDTLSHD